MLATDYLEDIGNANGMQTFFYLLFYAAFNLLILYFFIVIILSNYLHLLQKIHLTTTAMSRISAYESDLTSQKWINLIFMKPPIDIEAYISQGITLSDSEKCKFFFYSNCNFFPRFQGKRGKGKVHWG